VKTSLFLTSLLLALPQALAQDGTTPTRAEIAAGLNGVAAEDLRDSKLSGFYEVRSGARVGYITTDGRFLFEGDLFDLETRQNLTESARSEARLDMLNAVDPSDMIIYSPKDRPVEHTIVMFTDFDCGYCRQFHREIDRVNALGIEVHYLSYPRTGPGTESWTKAEKVWCAADRNSALTDAKLGGHVPEETCANTPINAQYELGQRIGLTGTPSIYAADGSHIGGYLAPDLLLQTLNQLAE
jgi:thiol:disulfide interchange protein DsbC